MTKIEEMSFEIILLAKTIHCLLQVWGYISVLWALYCPFSFEKLFYIFCNDSYGVLVAHVLKCMLEVVTQHA